MGEPVTFGGGFARGFSSSFAAASEAGARAADRKQRKEEADRKFTQLERQFEFNKKKAERDLDLRLKKIKQDAEDFKITSGQAEDRIALEREKFELDQQKIATDQKLARQVFEQGKAEFDQQQTLDEREAAAQESQFDQTQGLDKQRFTELQKKNSVEQTAQANARIDDLIKQQAALFEANPELGKTQAGQEVIKNMEKLRPGAGAILEALTQAGPPADVEDITDRSTDLVDFTPDAQGQPVATLTTKASNSIRGIVAKFFGGTFDPITLEFSGLDKGTTERALEVQTKAEEFLRLQDELSVGSAVRRAVREIKETEADDEAILKQARDAIAKGAPEDQVKGALEDMGIDPGKL